MPGEWEPHAATWIAWPHNRTDWPGKFACIPWVYAEIIRNLARVEQVNILVNDEAAEAAARDVLVTAECCPRAPWSPAPASGNISFWPLPTNRGWLRDTGPSFVRRDARGKISQRLAGCRLLALQCLGKIQRLEARRSSVLRDRRHHEGRSLAA